jgi:hypothetical protein
MKLKLPNTSLLQCVIVTAATDGGADKRANAFRTFNAVAADSGADDTINGLNQALIFL